MTEKTTEKKKKVPYYRKPADMTVEEWQIALRRQYIDKQEFGVQNIGNHPFFSDFGMYEIEGQAQAVQKATGVPVFDYITMINFVFSAVVKQKFEGYM